MSDILSSAVEARQKLIHEARSILDVASAENRGLTSEETAKYEAVYAEVEKRDEFITTAKNLAERESRSFEIASATPVEARAVDNTDSILRSIARGEVRSHEFMREQRAALVPSANTVGTSFYDRVFQIATLVGPMLQTSEVFNTTSGENLVIPTATAISTAANFAAGSAISESNPTFSSITLGADKYAALVSVSNELIADAGFNISNYIAEQLGTSLGIAVNTTLTSSLVTAAGSVVTGGTGVAGAPTYENLIDLVYGIADGARLLLPGLGFQASKTGIAAMRKLKDGTGHYLWTDSAVAGQPATFLGYPVYENPQIPAVATGAKSVLFGHLPSYKARIAGGFQIAQSGDYGFNTDTTTFRGIVRVGGGLTHATHIGYFKGAAS
jgi:HK97 family phage major capsid protein